MNSIPKKIHQIYIQGADFLPDDIKFSIEELKRKNSDWQYFFYDGDAIQFFIKNNYGEDIFNLYNKINPSYGAARADFFRYLLMYKEGGVYLDIKSSCSVPLNDIIPDDCEIMVCSWDSRPGGEEGHWERNPITNFLEDGEYQQWNIIVAPQSPYIKSVIEEVVLQLKSYKPWRDGVSCKAVFKTTGPVAFTLGIEKQPKSVGFHKVYNHRSIGLIYKNVDEYTIRAMNRNHYSKLRESLVLLHGAEKVYYKLWLIFISPLWRLRKNTITESVKFYGKIKNLLSR